MYLKGAFGPFFFGEVRFDMASVDMALFLSFALVAEVLGTVAGFGSSVLFVPLALMFFDFHSVLGITAVFHVASNLSKIFYFRQGLDRQLALAMGMPAVLFVILGGYMSRYFEGFALDIALAVFLIVLSLIFLLFRQLILRASNVNMALAGASSGFFAGLLGTGGALRGAALSAFNIQKDAFVATSAVIDFGVDFSRMVVYAANGYIQVAHLPLVPFLVGVSVVGTYAGKRILAHISQESFRIIVLSLILAVGGLTLLRALGVIDITLG